jgi:hypothetical protein
MNRLPASPLVARALAVAEKRLGIDELCRRLVAPQTMVQGAPRTLVDILTELDPSWVDWDELQPRK